MKPYGYIIVDPNTGALDWDSEVHETVQDAINSLTEWFTGMVREERPDYRDEKVPWWKFYDIHPVYPKINHEDIND